MSAFVEETPLYTARCTEKGCEWTFGPHSDEGDVYNEAGYHDIYHDDGGEIISTTPPEAPQTVLYDMVAQILKEVEHRGTLGSFKGYPMEVCTQCGNLWPCPAVRSR